ncbi:HypC/HybG/HupF family hydrogenase formation chaperone [Methyloprofundus sp.]|uniref:HypC/HybG/HupF family hydrogenase formation chaperone n=1 Tax=Methyloprofundus sp. TaxID=2020875 RepID=UPI003D0C7421
MCLAVPGKIISISDDEPLSRTGRIDFSGVTKEVSLAYLPEALINDYVIVHAGFALSIIDQHEAAESLKLFQELDSFEALL